MVGDWGYTADLVAEHGLGRALHGQDQAFRDLLDQLPADAARLDPELALLAAAERIAAGDGAEALLEVAREQERKLADDRRPRFALLLAVCRLLRASRAGDLDEGLAAGHDALTAHAQLGGTEVDDLAAAARAVALSGLGAAELWTGELDAAEAHLEAGQAAALAAGLDDVQLHCLSTLALVQAVGGRLGLAVRTGEAAIGLAGRHAGASSAVAGAQLALAWVHYQRDDLAAAGKRLERAAEAADTARDRSLGVAIEIVRERLGVAQVDPAGASAELSAMALLGSVDGGGPVAAHEAVTLARRQLAEADPAGAVGTLSPFLDGTMPAADLDTGIRAWLLHALASHDLGNVDQAATSLRQAVDLAEPEEHRRAFLDGGAPSRALVARYRDWIDGSWPFLDELTLAALDPAPAAVSPMPVLIEALSEREQAVLRYLPTMLTLVEIGSELYISVNTTKSHARNIYRKLGVVGRRDAVRRARQLQLLRS
jgi:LuxR family transcriptional regulator, maltose regulon positive regulatory protein